MPAAYATLHLRCQGQNLSYQAQGAGQMEQVQATADSIAQDAQLHAKHQADQPAGPSQAVIQIASTRQVFRPASFVDLCACLLAMDSAFGPFAA